MNQFKRLSIGGKVVTVVIGLVLLRAVTLGFNVPEPAPTPQRTTAQPTPTQTEAKPMQQKVVVTFPDGNSTADTSKYYASVATYDKGVIAVGWQTNNGGRWEQRTFTIDTTTKAIRDVKKTNYGDGGHDLETDWTYTYNPETKVLTIDRPSGTGWTVEGVTIP